MSIVLGIDIGGSTTKIVGFDKQVLLGTLQVRAADQITSMYGAIGNFLRANGLKLGDISKIVLTGVGASFVDEDIYELPTYKVDEFQAIGYGGRRLAGLDRALVVSIGTGTAFVRADKENRHIGGSGVGGGTLVGLSSQLLETTSVDMIESLAIKGDIRNVDLMIRDIMNAETPLLPPQATAANFGNVKSDVRKEDMAIGLINMVFQTVGMLSVFACLNDDIKDVVVIGALAMLPQGKAILYTISKMYTGVRFTIPPNAVFATAIGATVPFLEATL